MPPKKTKKGPVKWQFKIDLRKKNDDDDAWNDYDDKDSRRLEANYISYDDEFALNTTYAVDFTSMAQFRRDDRERERPIRRVDELGMPAYALADLPDVDVAAVKKLRKAPLKKAKNDDDADGDGVDDDDDDDGVVTTSTKSPTKKKSPAKAIAKKTLADDKLGVWQWENDDALWETYAEEDNDLIEKLHKAGVGKVTTDKFTFCAGYDTKYELDFDALTQTNLDSRKLRKIRRKDSMDADSGFAAVVKAKSMAWGASMTKKGAAASTTSSKSKPMTRASSMLLLKIPPPPDAAFLAEQASFGAQSCRPSGGKKTWPGFGHAVEHDAHGSYCFTKLFENEQRLCGEYAVFYHSYSLAALLYEVQAAVAAVLFRFKSNFASLPRLLKAPFDEVPDAPALLKLFNTKLAKGRQDHDPRFRAVGICASTNLVLTDPEATPKDIFLMGYSQADLSFTDVLKELLTGCSVPKKDVSELAKEIIAIAAEAGLDTAMFGGKHCKSGRPGHLLQIFLKRELVDQFVYAGLPMGPLDKARAPISKALAANAPIHGQVRICFNPSVFMRAQCARLFVYSADPTFHERREKFQEKLRELLQPVLGSDETRVAAALAIHGGHLLPDWFVSEEQTKHAIGVDNVYK